MVYLLSLAALIAVLGLTPPKFGLRQNNDKNYMLICGTVVALVMGLRTYLTGSMDTYSYMSMYKSLQNFESFQPYYDKRLSDVEFLFSESAFYYCAWLLGRVFKDPQAIVFFSSVYITWATCRFIYKNSADAPMSLLMYVCLGMFTFNMNGMRQACAMATCLFAFEFAKDRKIIRFALTVILAMLFHKSAIFFAPVFFVPFIKDSWGNVFIFLIIVFGIVLSFDQLLPWFNEATGKEYENDGGTDTGGISVVLIYVIAIVFSFLINALQKPEIRVPFLCVLTGFCMYLGRYMTTEIMERSSYYYYYFSILLIPGLIKELNEDEQKIVKILLIVFSIALFAYRLYVGNFRDFKFFYLARRF